MNYLENEKKYLRAKTKVDRIRGFYVHLIIYVIINTIVTVFKVSRNLENGETLDQALFDFATFALWVVWGVGLALHAFGTFGLDYILGPDWEQKRIEKYMEEERNSSNF